MTNVLLLALALVMGIILGIFYFGGLWLTIRQLPKTHHPIRLVLGSLVGRNLLTVLSFALIMDGHWERLLACLFSFLWMRDWMIRRSGAW